jgi:hypothetical protein
MKQHTVIISGGDKGGSGKTACLSAFADALISMGYTVRLVDADAATQTLTAIFPIYKVTSITTETGAELDRILNDISNSMTEDIALIDMPGGASAFVAKYFKEKTAKDFESVGLRIIIAVTVANKSRILRGVRAWLNEFAENYPIICFKNDMATDEGSQFKLNATNTGTAILQLAGERIIEFPQMSSEMIKDYDACFAVPSEFMLGGRAATKLGMFPLRCLNWNTHHRHITAAVAPHAEWLTKKPIPIPPAETTAKVDRIVDKALVATLKNMNKDDD